MVNIVFLFIYTFVNIHLNSVHWEYRHLNKLIIFAIIIRYKTILILNIDIKYKERRRQLYKILMLYEIVKCISINYLYYII